MKVLVISSGEKASLLSKTAARELVERGAQVDTIRDHDEIRGNYYQYLLFIVEGKGGSRNRVPQSLRNNLKNSRGITGKRSSVVVVQSLLFSNSTLKQAQQTLENEGIFLRNSLICKRESELIAFCKSLDLESYSH